VSVKAGVSAEKIEALDTYASSALFIERERAALDFAGELTRHDGEVSDACFHRLRTHFSEAQVVELVFVVGYQDFASTFARAFRLAPQGFAA
jgi:alkylhydroperoxidase family enzyme